MDITKKLGDNTGILKRTLYFLTLLTSLYVAGCSTAPENTGNIKGKVTVPRSSTDTTRIGRKDIGVVLNPDYKTLTNDSGYYFIGKIPEGNYTLSANVMAKIDGRGHNPAYIEQSFPIHVPKDSTLNIPIDLELRGLPPPPPPPGN